MSDETTPQDDAAMSPASAGSVVAWAVICGDCVDSTFTDRDEAVEWAYRLIPPGQIVPLYNSPALTDEELEAVEWCIFQQAVPQKTAVTMRRMLERLK